MFGSFIHYPQGFSLAAGDKFGFDDIDFNADPHHPLNVAGDFKFYFKPLFCAGFVNFLFTFYLNHRVIQISFFTDHEALLGFHFRNFQKQRFNLGWEYVDAADDQHVIGSAGKFVHLEKCSAAGTGLAAKAGNVLGPVSQHGHGPALQGGKDQFPFFTHGQRLKGHRVHNFRQKMIFVDVHAVLSFAVKSHAGSAKLGQAVDFMSPNAHAALYFIAHSDGPGLSAKSTYPKRQVSDVNFQLLSPFSDGQGQHRAVDPKSFMSMIWRSVRPELVGMTVQPKRVAPW